MNISGKYSILMAGFLTMLISLNGCTTCANAVPNDEPTMAEIYEQAMQQSHCSTLAQARWQVKIHVDYATKIPLSSRLNPAPETNPLFPTLPNPQLVMYVYPHLSETDEAPIPGYTTAFSLYEKNYYAVEGEVKPNYFRD